MSACTASLPHADGGARRFGRLDAFGCFLSVAALSYWRTASGVEIDFIWSRGRKKVGIEVKASRRWRPEFSKALATALNDGIVSQAIGVYLGDSELVDGQVRVLPATVFCQSLAEGKLFQ